MFVFVPCQLAISDFFRDARDGVENFLPATVIDGQHESHTLIVPGLLHGLTQGILRRAWQVTEITDNLQSDVVLQQRI